MGRPSISHLFFADDSLIFFKAEEGACSVLKEILMTYESASGQKVNFEKSSICFSRNVPLSNQVALAALINVTWVTKHDLYLGLPMDISYSKVDAFSFLKEKVRNKLQGWRGNTLSAAGKEVLLKSVVQSIPTYVMSCFELPKQFCHELHQLMARFWWGAKGEERKIHWLAWEKLCVPKREGGLGFKNLISFNLSLLAKQGWRLLMSPDSLIARFFKARYYPNDSFMAAPFRSGMSYTWRSILAGREVLSKGLRYQIGDGSMVSLWSDPWLPLPYSFKPFSCPMDGTELWKVRDLIDEVSTEWMSLVVDELFSSTEAAIILSIPLSLRPTVDRLVWHFDKKGLYTVKSGYYAQCTHENLHLPASSSSSSAQGRTWPWSVIWKARIPPKVRMFIWRLLKGIIPTRVALARKFQLVDLSCVFCRSGVESDLHIFMHCPTLNQLWQSGGLKLKPHNSLAHSMMDWCLEVLEVIPGHLIDFFFMQLWTIWSERNNILWNEGEYNPWLMPTLAARQLEEFHRCHPLPMKNKQRPLSHWTCPPSGRLKINVDGAFVLDSKQGGIGVIVRNEDGECVGAFARTIPHAISAVHMEAEACRAGLLLAIHQSWFDVELESDCAMVISALANPDADFSDIGRILDDCKEYIKGIGSFTFRHIYREANGVAHRLAYLASFSNIDDVWLDETPSIIEDVLYEDICNCTRGQGSMSPPSHNHL